MTEKDLILRFPREIKLDCLRAALDQGELGVFLGLSKILLDANISDGGIETEVIEKIHNDYMNKP